MTIQLVIACLIIVVAHFILVYMIAQTILFVRINFSTQSFISCSCTKTQYHLNHYLVIYKHKWIHSSW